MAKRRSAAAAAAAPEFEDVEIEETETPAAQVTDEEKTPLDVAADRVELSLDDETAQALRDVQEPEEESTEEITEEEPAKPAAAAPKPPEKPKENLRPALREERGKRKRYAEIAKAAVTHATSLEAQLRQMQMAGVVIPPRDAAKLADIKVKAEKADTMGEVVDLVVDFVEERYKTIRSAEKEHDLKVRVAKCEIDAREKYGEEYDKRLKAAGVLDATKIVNGQYVNPRVAFEIYTDDNPAEAAWEIATEILKGKGELPEDEGQILTPDGEIKGEEKKPKKPAAAAPAEPAAPAASAKPKPRGINGLQPAGKPKLGFSRKDLDRLLEKNPAAYEALIQRRPEVGDWHLGKE